jgi:peptide/nickel transport system permease protein
MDSPVSADSERPLVDPQLGQRGKLGKSWQFFRTWPVIPVAIISILLIFAIFAPFIANHNPERGDLFFRNVPPSWDAEGSAKFLLGTDPLGRDIWSRIVFGARISIIVAGIVLTFGATGGVIIGLIAGYRGGNIDEILMRIVDLTFAIPFILVALVVVIVMGQSMTVIIILLIAFSWGGFARQVRGEALALRNRDYVLMAQILGGSSPYIIYRHILPGVINTVLVIGSLRVGSLILAEAILSYLGVGVPPPTPAWGAMVSEGRDYISSAWWVTFFPGVAIFLTVLAFNFLGDWLRDYFDPRLRQLMH